MKLNNVIRSLSVGLAVLGTSLTSFAGTTIVHKVATFINNGTYLCLTNNSTWSYLSASNIWFYSWTVGTNVLALGGTNSAGVLYPPAIVDVPSMADDDQGDVNPNLAIQVIMGVYTNFPLPSVQSPAFLNTISTNPVPTVFTNEVSSTNTVTFTFAAESYGFADNYKTSTKTFVFTMQQTNNVPLVFTTNLPTTFISGAEKIRLVSMTADSKGDGGNNGAMIDAINEVGWYH